MNKILTYILIVLIVVVVVMVGILLYRETRKTSVIALPQASSSGIKTAFSLENAPSESIKGEIATMSGEVKWQSRTATEESSLVLPRELQQGEKLETGDNSKAVIIFQNAIQINFAQDTAIDFVQTLPVNLVFSLEKGSAKFTKTGNFPIAVRIEHLLVQENGDMSISINPINGFVTLNIVKGDAIAAYNDTNYQSHEVSLTKGDTFIFNDDTRRGVIE